MTRRDASANWYPRASDVTCAFSRTSRSRRLHLIKQNGKQITRPAQWKQKIKLRMTIAFEIVTDTMKATHAYSRTMSDE